MGMTASKKFIYFISLISISLVLLSCVTTAEVKTNTEEELLYPQETYIDPLIQWQKVNEGIYRSDFSSPTIKLIYHLVKIDLNAQNMDIAYYPDRSLKDQSIFMGKKTKNFARENNCTVAFNTTPFERVNLLKVKLVGIHKAQDILYSAPVEKYSALAFKDNRAYLIQNQNYKINQYDYIFGGFFTILCNGEIRDFTVHSYDSRTAVGIAQDGEVIYILAVEGEKKGHSLGMSYQMCARLLKSLGCSDAIEMDGGSSTDLIVNGRSVLTYHAMIPQAASIGFRKLEE